MTYFVTGPAGFIGSAVARLLVAAMQGTEGPLAGGASAPSKIILFDKLTYAGFLGNIEGLVDNMRVFFVQGDICDFEQCLALFRKHKVMRVLNLAAESHVDNSIHGPLPFMETNIMGTFRLLEAARQYWSELDADAVSSCRFLHVSTDEVFGELGAEGFFTEATAYSPNSPYSASKASSDHLARAWHHTYDLPVIVTNCSNNYGPRQFPEKLIPRMIDCALSGQPLPVYGRGENVRDWIHVEDHALGLLLALERGQVGGTYCFGGRSERRNIDVVRALCGILDELRPLGGVSGVGVADGATYADQIQFVTDRAGHDWRYAIDDSKAERELGFTRRYKNFEEGLRHTIQWYLDNQAWIEQVKTRDS